MTPNIGCYGAGQYSSYSVLPKKEVVKVSKLRLGTRSSCPKQCQCGSGVRMRVLGFRV